MIKPKITPVIFNVGLVVQKGEALPVGETLFPEKKLPIVTKPKIYELYIKEKIKMAYVDATGKLFIPTPVGNTYTIYPSINHYNDRLGLPHFEKKQNINIENMVTVFIDLKTLTIII